MIKRLRRSFFSQPTLVVAKKLLGKYLCRKIGKQVRAGKIVETEAYIGPKDRASHACEGRLTKRNRAEYMVGGHIYIYLVYGMYWQLNISTSLEGKPECVLIRALEPVIIEDKKPEHKTFCFVLGRAHKYELWSKIKNQKYILKMKKLASGPGKLCQWLKIDKSFYGEDLVISKRIWLATSIPLRQASPKWQEGRGARIKMKDIIRGSRIGIDYAGPIWSKKLWRFYLKNNQFVSRIKSPKNT